jgi:hypothetical protein
VDGSGASVSCTVKANAGGFDVYLTVQQGPYAFNTVSLGHVAADDGVTIPAGTLPADVDDSSPAVGATGTTLYDPSTCALTYDDVGHGSIGPGHIWGNLVCTNLQDDSKSVINSTGGTQPMTCSGTIDFRFENCAQ